VIFQLFSPQPIFPSSLAEIRRFRVLFLPVTTCRFLQRLWPTPLFVHSIYTPAPVDGICPLAWFFPPLFSEAYASIGLEKVLLSSLRGDDGRVL